MEFISQRCGNRTEAQEMTRTSSQRLFLVTTFVVAASAMLAAQAAEVYIHVRPPEAQVFIDDKYMGNSGRTFEITPGTHTVSVYNYGFAPQSREVSLNQGEAPTLEFRLQRPGNRVSVPWGRIQIEDAPDDAGVFLNGSTHGYLVGHADMFNNNTVWRQQLVVPAGKHQVIVTRREGGVVWSGDVDVQPNKRVIIHTATGRMTLKDWPQGPELSSLPRFVAGGSTASVPV